MTRQIIREQPNNKSAFVPCIMPTTLSGSNRRLQAAHVAAARATSTDIVACEDLLDASLVALTCLESSGRLIWPALAWPGLTWPAPSRITLEEHASGELMTRSCRRSSVQARSVVFFDGLRHALNCRRAREAREYGNLSWDHVRRGGSTPHHTTPQGGVPRQALRASKCRDLTV